MKAICLAGVFLLAPLLIGATDQQPASPTATNAAERPAAQTQKFKPVFLAEIITCDGTRYHGVTVRKVDPDGLMIEYKLANGGAGLAKLKFQDLPATIQKQFEYDPKKAAAFEAGNRRAMGQWRAQLIADDEAARAKRQAAELEDAQKEAKGSGTGFLVTDDGYLLTNYHVVTNATRLWVNTIRGLLPAEVVKFDSANDVALLKVEGSFHGLPLVSSNGVRLGESVFTVGFPNPTIQGMELKLTRGEISGMNGLQDDPRAYQISVPAQPGNSGGALVDEYGNVVGIVTARLSDETAIRTSGMRAQNVNYAVKSSTAWALVKSVPGVQAKLKPLHPARTRKFEDVVREAQEAAALVLVY